MSSINSGSSTERIFWLNQSEACRLIDKASFALVVQRTRLNFFFILDSF